MQTNKESFIQYLRNLEKQRDGITKPEYVVGTIRQYANDVEGQLTNEITRLLPEYNIGSLYNIINPIALIEIKHRWLEIREVQERQQTQIIGHRMLLKGILNLGNHKFEYIRKLTRHSVT